MRAALKSAGFEIKREHLTAANFYFSQLFEAVRELKQRYGSAYASEFPYLSQAILAFQQVGGRDVLPGNRMGMLVRQQ